MREARLAADVEILIVAHKNESESLRKARLAADVERVIIARKSWSIFIIQGICFNVVLVGQQIKYMKYSVYTICMYLIWQIFLFTNFD